MALPSHVHTLLMRLARGEAVRPDDLDLLGAGVLYEAAGALESAHAAYELCIDEGGDEAPEVTLAEGQLLALEANAGHPDARLRLAPLLDGDEHVVTVVNHAIFHWRAGRNRVAAELLLEADAAARSPLGRAVEESLAAHYPGVRARLVSPLLLVASERAAASGDRQGLERALALEPGNADAALRLARFELAADHPSAARGVVSALLERYPGWSDALALATQLGAPR